MESQRVEHDLATKQTIPLFLQWGEVSPQGPQHVTLFGRRGFADVTNYHDPQPWDGQWGFWLWELKTEVRD